MKYDILHQFHLGNVQIILRYHSWGPFRPPPLLYYQGLSENIYFKIYLVDIIDFCRTFHGRTIGDRGPFEAAAARKI